MDIKKVDKSFLNHFLKGVLGSWSSRCHDCEICEDRIRIGDMVTTWTRKRRHFVHRSCYLELLN